MPAPEFALQFSDHIPSAWFDAAQVDQLSRAEIQDLNNAYDASIAYADYHVGRLLAQLQSRGILENTLVIIAGDHGEQFGEHSLMYHGNSLYLPALHVPLIVSLPSRVPSGVVVSETVSLRDLPATVFDLLRLQPQADFPGSSLSRYWSPGSTNDAGNEFIFSEMDRVDAFPEHYPARRGDLRSVIWDGKHFIQNGDGEQEIYDLRLDPLESQDLSSTDAGRTALDRLRVALQQQSSRTL
jgi:arylsulfatase A-like enzyme